MALLLGVYADNKVEGLALSKGLGILYFAPLLGYILKAKWKFIAGLLPPFWIAEAFVDIYISGNGYYYYLFAGFLVHFIFLAIFINKFKRKVE